MKQYVFRHSLPTYQITFVLFFFLSSFLSPSPIDNRPTKRTTIYIYIDDSLMKYLCIISLYSIFCAFYSCFFFSKSLSLLLIQLHCIAQTIYLRSSLSVNSILIWTGPLSCSWRNTSWPKREVSSISERKTRIICGEDWESGSGCVSIKSKVMESLSLTASSSSSSSAAAAAGVIRECCGIGRICYCGHWTFPLSVCG